MARSTFTTDLARESLAADADRLPGIRQSEHESGGFTVHTVRVTDPEAAERIGKPIGTYLTLDCGRSDRLEREERERLARVLSGELRGLAEKTTGKKPDGAFSVLVAGLGNDRMTADAVGPSTARRLPATAHLRRLDPDLYRSLGCCAVSLIVPGVLAQSGMEAGALVRAVADRVGPDLVVAVDALAARDPARLAATVQLSDVGIVPGSGVGNRRWAVTRETVGVPVIALGVPTVVGSATLVRDALEKAGIGEPGPELSAVLENGKDFFVSLKECDAVVEAVCSVLSRALSLAFLGGMEA